MSKNEKTSSKKILLVDDEKDMGWVMERILTDEGYQLMTAHTAAEGLAKFRKAAGSIRLVLLDLRLPDMSGLKLLEKIKALSSHTKIFLITAFGTPESKKLAREKGAIEILDKPFRVEKLLKAVRLAFAGNQNDDPRLRK